MFESVRGREEGKLRFSKSPHPNLACQLLYSYIKERIKLRREGGRRRKGKKKKREREVEVGWRAERGNVGRKKIQESGK